MGKKAGRKNQLCSRILDTDGIEISGPKADKITLIFTQGV